MEFNNFGIYIWPILYFCTLEFPSNEWPLPFLEKIYKFLSPVLVYCSSPPFANSSAFELWVIHALHENFVPEKIWTPGTSHGGIQNVHSHPLWSMYLILIYTTCSNRKTLCTKKIKIVVHNSLQPKFVSVQLPPQYNCNTWWNGISEPQFIIL
jgi:hypothetical protein